MTPWQDRAACAGKPTEWFFAESSKGRPGKIPLDPYANARELCAECPVRNECLEWAMSRNEWGFLGGMSQLERQALKRRLQRSRKAIA